MSLRPEARGFIDTEERRPSGEGPAFDAGNEQDVRSCLPSSPKESAPEHAPSPRTWASTPMTGFFGTDFWHAVEFSRNGRAPVRVSRPVVGQPLHAMSGRPPCQSGERAGRAAPGHATAEAGKASAAVLGRSPGPAARRPVPVGPYETKNA